MKSHVGPTLMLLTPPISLSLGKNSLVNQTARRIRRHDKTCFYFPTVHGKKKAPSHVVTIHKINFTNSSIQLRKQSLGMAINTYRYNTRKYTITRRGYG